MDTHPCLRRVAQSWSGQLKPVMVLRSPVPVGARESVVLGPRGVWGLCNMSNTWFEESKSQDGWDQARSQGVNVSSPRAWWQPSTSPPIKGLPQASAGQAPRPPEPRSWERGETGWGRWALTAGWAPWGGCRAQRKGKPKTRLLPPLELLHARHRCLAGGFTPLWWLTGDP